MADTKVTALTAFTPVLTDIIYGVDDPGGTPASGKLTLTSVLSLFQTNTDADDISDTSTTNKFATAAQLAKVDYLTVTGAVDLDTIDSTVAGLGALADNDTVSVGEINATGTASASTYLRGDGSWSTPAGTGGIAWSDAVDSDIVPDADGTRDLGTTSNRFAELHVDTIDLNGITLDGTTLADPNADRILFWDDSAGSTAYLTASTGLSISTTNLSVDTAVVATLTGSQTLTNKTLTAPVISTISNTGTLTLPTATDTLVGRATTDTLTNKTLTDAKVTLSVNAQTGTSYTLVLTDAHKKVTMSNASANTLNVPANASVAFPVGTVIGVTMLGAGTTTVDGATGVTINGVSGGAGAISARYTGVTLTKLATDTWVMEGNHGTVA